LWDTWQGRHPSESRKRVRDGLPKRINETLAKGRELVKEAKGLS
jgi:hypothetical protein